MDAPLTGSGSRRLFLDRVLDAEEPRVIVSQLGRVPLFLLRPGAPSARGSIFQHRHRTYALAKRSIDLSLAAVLAVITLAILPIVALALRCEGAGPVIVRHACVGPGHRPFSRFSFRSTPPFEARQPTTCPDALAPRASVVGIFLWRTRLDDLPQAWNVLRGEMSLVGPRPVCTLTGVDVDVALSGDVAQAHARPGMTGWSQLCLPNPRTDKDLRRVLEYDLYYWSQAGVRVDLQILAKSVRRLIAHPLRHAPGQATAGSPVGPNRHTLERAQ